MNTLEIGPLKENGGIQNFLKNTLPELIGKINHNPDFLKRCENLFKKELGGK